MFPDIQQFIPQEEPQTAEAFAWRGHMTEELTNWQMAEITDRNSLQLSNNNTQTLQS